MTRIGTKGLRRLFLTLALALTGAAATQLVALPVAQADGIKKHKVYKGQTLGKIAKRYNVTIGALCEANGIGRRHPIKPGEVLWVPPRSDEDGSQTRKAREKAEARDEPKASPKKRSAAAEKKRKGSSRAELEKGTRWHRVYAGQKLGSIAKRYHVTVGALCHANAIRRQDPIRPGQMLLVPHREDEGGEVARALHDAGARPPSEGGKKDEASAKTARNERAQEAKKSWERYVRKPPRPRYITIVGRKGRSWKGTAVTRRGTARSYARRRIAKVLATRGGKTRPIDRRLVELLAVVSDTFGGRTIRVVSGVRLGNTPKGSRHRHGRAVDFVVEGVPNEMLRDYLKTFDQVGVGYYPNSHFVHLDVRDKWTYWIDLSSPGQAPRYAGFWTKASKSAKPKRVRNRGVKKRKRTSGKKKM